MQIISRFAFIFVSPILLYIYWRNSIRELDNLHAHFELKYLE
jgi:hypothetical protein